MKHRGSSSAALLGLAFIGCNQPSSGHSAAALASPSASTQTPSTAPLDGSYRVDALLALNPKAVQELGGERLSVDDMMRKSANGAAYVYSHWVVRFSGDKLATRNDMILNLRNGYQWEWCEGEGTGIWKGQQLSLPTGVAAHSRGGFVDHEDSHSGACNVNIAAGTYTLQQDAGETRLSGFHDGGNFAFVLVKDDSDPDIETRAHTLAGNPKK
jgi:hypothetical protein